MNDGRTPWNNTDHLVADLWALWAGKEDHPTRAEARAKAYHAEKSERVIQMNEKRKRTQGLR